MTLDATPAVSADAAPSSPAPPPPPSAAGPASSAVAPSAAGPSSPSATAGGGTVRFVTGDAVSLDLPVAQLGSRMLARLVDLVIQVVLYLVLAMVVPILLLLLQAIGVVAFDDALYAGAMVLVAALVLVGYPVTMEALTGGRTLGKLALGLRVVRDDGGPIRFRQAATRGLVSVAVEWPGLIAPPLTWLASIWTMAVSPQAKRLGDYAAGTLVIHERTAARWGRYPVLPPALAGWAATLDLAGLDDDLALVVRHFLYRSAELREPARSRLASQLMAEVAAVVRPAPPAGLHPVLYLATVHAERHHRAANRLRAVSSRTAAMWPGLVRPPRPAVMWPGLAGPPHPAVPVAAPGPTPPASRPAVPPLRPPTQRDPGGTGGPGEAGGPGGSGPRPA
ncbi:RDD family protein [Micromonospora sp. SL1-18]|uniref:RDD family protein n=1 Tax=Micromonospora sp. SL1-18 TaxID=3399128 RepID=UPI003A4E099B